MDSRSKSQNNRAQVDFIFRALTAICLLLGLSLSTHAQQAARLIGDWSGDSICFGNNPSCHDEKVVYHISVDDADPSKIKIAADKMVNGKLEWMGDVYLKYDPVKQTLTGDLQNSRNRGVWEFTVKDNIIEGGLFILPDRAVGRKIRFRKMNRSKRNHR